MKHFFIFVLLALLLAACAPAVEPAETPEQPSAADLQNTAAVIAQTSVARTQTALPAASLQPYSTVTFTPDVTLLASTLTPPPLTPPPMITPDATQVERWREYQAELAKAIYSYSPDDPSHQQGYYPGADKDAICEWDILGRFGQEVYLWVACISADGLWLESHAAIVYLELDGSIQGVSIVREGADPHTQLSVYDIYLFPIDVQEKLCSYYFYGNVPQCDSIASNYFPTYSLRPGESALLAHLKHREKRRDEPPFVVLSALPTTTPMP